MAEIDYRPFDYFSTNMFYIDIDWSEIDKYGVTKDEVEKFLEIMEKDRKAWEKKWNAIDNWGVGCGNIYNQEVEIINVRQV
jgi:hypothetical protein